MGAPAVGTGGAEAPCPKLQVVAAVKRFGSTLAVDRVSLEVAAGEIVALLGPSGSGKTTLLKLLGGHEQPDEGDIRIDGCSIAGLAANRIPAATVFQSYALFPHYDVYQNVAFGLRMRGTPEQEVRRRVDAVLGLVGLQGFERRRVTTLSGGEKQRIATARALAIEPEIILMDEPLGALDRLIRLRMQRELGALLRRIGMTTIYVTHNQHEALTMADRIAVMERSRIRQIGSPVDIYRRPRDRFVADFMGEANFIGGEIRVIDGLEIEVVAGPLTVRARRQSDQEFRVGALVDALLRPEDVQLEPAARGTGGWLGRVVDAVYSGELTEYVVAVDGLEQSLRVKALGTPAAEPGSRVRLSWSIADAVIFRRDESDGASPPDDRSIGAGMGGG